MKEKRERCDACGKFVLECSLVVEMADDDEPTGRSICQKCDHALNAAKTLNDENTETVSE